MGLWVLINEGWYNTITLGNTSITAIYAEKTTITGLSDARYKKDITPSDLGLDFIEKLKPVSYRLRNGDDTLDYGFTAQDTEKALPEMQRNLIEHSKPEHGLAMVVHDSHDVYHMAYGELDAPIVKAIQQQEKEIAALRNTLGDLETAHHKLRLKRVALKKQIAALSAYLSAHHYQLSDLAPASAP